jgi:hypothetical protein
MQREIDFYRDGEEVIYTDYQPKLPTPQETLNKKVAIWGLVFGIANSLCIGFLMSFAAFMQFKEGGSSFLNGAYWFILSSIAGIYPIFTVWSLRKLLYKIKKLN